MSQEGPASRQRPPAPPLLARVESVWSTVAGGEVVLLDRSRSRCHVLDAGAALIWDALDAPRTAEGVVDEIGVRVGPLDAAERRSVITGLALFADLGVVEEIGVESVASPERVCRAGSAPARREGGAAPRVPPVDRWAPAVERLLAARVEGTRRPGHPGVGGGEEWATVGPVALGSKGLEVHTDDPEVAAQVAAAVRALGPARSGTAVVAAYVLRAQDRRDGRWRVVVDGRVWTRLTTVEATVDRLLTRVYGQAILDPGGCLAFHAGAVERDGRVAVVAGPSGFGKSTLVGNLVRRGARYLTDEAAFVEPGSWWVTPFAKSVDVDASAPGLRAAVEGTERGPGVRGKVRVPVDRLGVVSPGGRASVLVVLDRPTAPDGGVDEAVALTPAEALAALLPNTFAATFEAPDALDHLAALCESVRCVRLPRLPVDRAASLVEELLDGTTNVDVGATR